MSGVRRLCWSVWVRRVGGSRTGTAGGWGWPAGRGPNSWRIPSSPSPAQQRGRGTPISWFCQLFSCCWPPAASVYGLEQTVFDHHELILLHWVQFVLKHDINIVDRWHCTDTVVEIYQLRRQQMHCYSNMKVKLSNKKVLHHQAALVKMNTNSVIMRINSVLQ